MKPLAPGTARVGWVGTGVMGRWMAEHVLRAGYALTVFNRSPGKAAPLVELGATLAASPREVAERSDVVAAIVGHPADVRAVFLGPNGALAGSRPGMTLIDLTTSEPALAVEVHARAAERGVFALDAPVSGGDIGAKAGTLSVMVGGDAAVFAAALPLLQTFGKTVVHQGGPGAGQHTKMVNQILIASTMVAVCEALLYARRAGLDPDTVLKSVTVGAAGSKALEVLGPRILKGDYAPGFYVEHFLKDLGIALAGAERMRLTLPGLVLARSLYVRVSELGHARSGTQALYLALEAMNGAGPVPGERGT